MVNGSVQSNYTIELFHSRRHQLYEFIATTEDFNSHRIGSGLDTNMAAVLLFWDTNMADMTSCEILATLETRRKLGRVSFGKDFWVRY